MFNLSSISSLAFLDEPRLQVGTLRSRRLEVMGVGKKGACERDTRPCVLHVYNCTVPQMIPKMDRKWSPLSTRNTMVGC